MPAVLFLHAFPLNRAMWQPQIAALPQGWTAIAPDFKGFGDAAPDDEVAGPRETVSLDDYADDVVAAMDTHGARQAVVCGCSMGGYVALALLRRHPGRVAGLVLADTRETADSQEGLQGRREMLALLSREGVSAVAAQVVPRLVGATTLAERPAVVGEVARLASRASAAGVDRAIVRMMNRPDATPVLAAYRGPLLVIVGAEDTLAPVGEAERMAALVPGTRLAVLPGAGHLANLETPDAFNVALCAFLSGLQP